MKSLPLVLRVLAFFLASALVARAAHPFFCTDSYGGKVAQVSADGKIIWEYACKHPQDGWVLANGNFLFCYNTGVIEMTGQKEIVWHYKSDPKTEIHACQPLPGGLVMIVESGPCRIIEVERNGRIAKEIKLTPPPEKVKIHDQFRGARKTKDGRYIVARKGEHVIEELDASGKTLRLTPVPGDVHNVLPLPNGNLLISLGDGHKVEERDANMKVVWELNENDIPGHPLRLTTGFQRLPNGNTIFTNYLGHGHIGKQPHFFELTPDRKVVWSFEDHVNFKTVNQIQVMDVKGDPTKWEILR
ncbi:MAG TPA: hypothetical protein VHO24_19985 [Opitutaceae bacterium]|nr:hypothetical protein [Opitutaceae bacterium]